jgi:glycosyltransferase involved in cell wall biosynthesis
MIIDKIDDRRGIKISVVTVCYNSATLLEETIKSVLAQKSKNFEYIIVDGKSTDSTAEILEKYRDKIDTIVSEPDRGIYDAMNKGARLSSGDYIIYMNAGDKFADELTIARLVDDINVNSEVVYGDVIKADAQGNDVVKPAEEPHNSHRMYFCHQSSLVARGTILSHPFDISHKLSADFKLMKTLYNEGAHFQQLHYPIARFDTGGVSNRRRSDGLRDNLRVIAETDSLIDRLRLAPRLWVPYIMCRLRGK